MAAIAAAATRPFSCGRVVDGGDEEVDGEYIERPPAARPAWHEGFATSRRRRTLLRLRAVAELRPVLVPKS